MIKKDLRMEAILKINPNAVVTVREDKIEWHEDTTPISQSEIEAMIPIVEQELKDAEAKKIADKEAANAKLRALGLTDDEIEAFRS
jgi:transcriptional regulator NrdR family protein